MNRAPYWATVKGYDHYSCSTCRHLFVWPKPSQKVLDDFYADPSYYDSAEEQGPRLSRDAEDRIRLIEKLAKSYGVGKRLLDVGCASGYFLSVARRHGFQVVGQDRSQAIAERARRTHGLDVRVGAIEDNILREETFPIVTAWEVVEHAREPRALFKALSDSVETHGLLAISSPMGNGIPARVLGKSYPMLIPPEHLSIFSRNSLSKLATEQNFVEVYFSSFSNLTVQSLRSGFARLAFRKELADVNQIQALTCVAAGAAVAWAPLVIDWLGYGTEMLVIYRKQ